MVAIQFLKVGPLSAQETKESVTLPPINIVELPGNLPSEERARHLYPLNLIDHGGSNRDRTRLKFQSYVSEVILTWDMLNQRDDLISYTEQYSQPFITGSGEGLYIFLHGLGSHPGVWYEYLKELESSNISMWAPHILNKGNASLKKTADEILRTTTEYLAQFPQSPIIFVATSNGARIAQYCEIKLRQQQHSSIILASIAGAIGGSKRIKYRYPITDEDLYKELHYLSPHSIKLIEQAREELPSSARRTFYYYATAEDSTVVPFNASLPLIKQNERFFLLRGVNHRTIVNVLSSEVLKETELKRIEYLNINTPFVYQDLFLDKVTFPQFLGFDAYEVLN